MAKITVRNTEVNVVKVNGEDYICLTDIFKHGEYGSRLYRTRDVQE